MTEIKQIWTGDLPPYPDADIALIRPAAGGELYEVYACFWLFRYLHRFEHTTAALAGDYCFGRFSHHLATLDNVELTDAFSAFLREDTLEARDIGAYLNFVRESSRLMQ